PRTGRADRRLRGMPEERQPLGAPPHVPDVWEDRLLRLLSEPACEPPCTRGRASGRPLGRARRGLELVLRRRGDVRPDLTRVPTFGRDLRAQPPLGTAAASAERRFACSPPPQP